MGKIKTNFEFEARGTGTNIKLPVM